MAHLVVSALKGPRQEQLKASLSYTARPEVLPWEYYKEQKWRVIQEDGEFEAT